MRLFKQLDKLVTKGFVGPYLISFLVAEFVLVLQFIWRHIDDFIGRGVSANVIIEMILYYSMTIIPLALPISILISSVMVYGTMAEKYELTSFKSAGVSLYRIIRPGVMIALGTAIFSIFSSNYLKPNAFLSFYQIFDNVRRAKPTLTIDQGIFCYDFKGYAIRVGKKDADGRGIHDILIYDQTDRNLLGLITADDGEMFTSPNGQYFTMELRNGVQYSEMERKDERGKRDQDQFMRIYFDKFVKQFDMSEFEFAMSQNSMGRRKHDLYNSFQMQEIIDSIDRKMEFQINKSRYFYSGLVGEKEISLTNYRNDSDQDEFRDKYLSEEEKTTVSIENKNAKKFLDEKLQEKIASQSTIDKQENAIQALSENRKNLNKATNKNRAKRQGKADQYYGERTDFRLKEYSLDTLTSFGQTVKQQQMDNILFRAKSSSQTLKESYRSVNTTLNSAMYNRNRYQLRLHQQICWALVCILFLFIGASFGSIVRKGGFGYPLLVAIVFFVIFIFTNIMGEKLMTGGNMSAIMGAWLPCLVLTPFAIIFTYKAVRDSRFNINFNVKSWFT